jgi:hypothetical protein
VLEVAGKRCRARLAIVLVAVVATGAGCLRRSSLPASLADRDFWSLIETLSEPAGTFALSDNVVSNEPHYADTIHWLRPGGGAYVGVGPDQNFSYIVGLRPAMAFVIDIRRENLDLHLMYKALFELSTDRADFVSRLFSRPRPKELPTSASVDEMFSRYDAVAPSAAQYKETTALVRARLTNTRGLPLAPADLDWIETTLGVFFTSGPGIDYYGSNTVNAVRPSYRQLMTARDFSGVSQGFLATEEGFTFVKDLHTRNLIVPVVGDFGGPSAMRRVGDYVRRHGEVINAVYGSNVGAYLTSQQTRAFCRNLESLPAASPAWFIDSHGRRSLQAKLRTCPTDTN